MKTRAALGILAAAGLASTALAQESVSYTLSWIEVNAGTTTPVAAPNGTIDPGEGARISISLNITPGIGSPATYTPPPPPGTGTVAGIGSIFFDLLASNANGGTWGPITRGIWALGGAGTGVASGGLIDGQAGQFVLPGGTANSSNPINNIWRGVWTPSDYSSRNVGFLSAGAVTSGGQHTSILIKYGTDAGGNDQYVAKFVGATFGGTTIPVAPAPSSLALLGLGAMVAGRRRR